MYICSVNLQLLIALGVHGIMHSACQLNPTKCDPTSTSFRSSSHEQLLPMPTGSSSAAWHSTLWLGMPSPKIRYEPLESADLDQSNEPSPSCRDESDRCANTRCRGHLARLRKRTRLAHYGNLILTLLLILTSSVAISNSSSPSHRECAKKLSPYCERSRPSPSTMRRRRPLLLTQLLHSLLAPLYRRFKLGKCWWLLFICSSSRTSRRRRCGRYRGIESNQRRRTCRGH